MAIGRGDEEVPVSNVFDNTSVQIIKITHDKLENVLLKHIDRIRKRKDIVGAVGLVVSLTGVWLTADFRDKWVNADVWRGVFLSCSVMALVYLINAIITNCRKKYRVKVEDIMNDIKRNEQS